MFCISSHFVSIYILHNVPTFFKIFEYFTVKMYFHKHCDSYVLLPLFSMRTDSFCPAGLVLKILPFVSWVVVKLSWMTRWWKQYISVYVGGVILCNNWITQNIQQTQHYWPHFRQLVMVNQDVFLHSVCKHANYSSCAAHLVVCVREHFSCNLL